MLRRIFLLLLLFSTRLDATTDPLPSWNEGSAKTAILQFVADVTTYGHPDFVAEEQRIAVFDQDGTLWVEHPIYAQAYFLLDQVKHLARLPNGKDLGIIKTLLHADIKSLIKLGQVEINRLLGILQVGMTCEEYRNSVQDWLARAKHPKLNKPFHQLVYQPMLEVIQLLKNNGFTPYIVSGGGQEFIRAYAEIVYGIPPEHVIGTAVKVKYTYADGVDSFVRTPKLLWKNEKKHKAETIHLMIGRRPIVAFGNSDGDLQMLQFTHAGTKRNLALLVHHDDKKREYAYDSHTYVGTFSDALREEAQQNDWIIVSMKNDWNRIFR